MNRSIFSASSLVVRNDHLGMDFWVMIPNNILANLSKQDRLCFTKSLAPQTSIHPILLSMLLP